MIALFGGTSDPVHVGHVAAATAAAKVLGVAQVRLIVAAHPYHKASNGRYITGADQRLEMLDIACAGDARLVADGSDLQARGAMLVGSCLAGVAFLVAGKEDEPVSPAEVEEVRPPSGEREGVEQASPAPEGRKLRSVEEIEAIDSSEDAALVHFELTQYLIADLLDLTSAEQAFLDDRGSPRPNRAQRRHTNHRLVQL